MSGNPTVTDPSAFEKKSLGLQIVLVIITLGLYSLYWFYSTAKQLDNGTDANLTPILGIIPILNLICAWQISSAAEDIAGQSKVVLFVLFLVFAPISWYFVQSGINEVAARGAA